jgi:putative addiction module component (TIGR02574 family)
MSLALNEIVTAALALPPEERQILVERMEDSLARVPILHQEEWKAEVERRIRDLEAGRTKLIPAEEVFAGIRASIEQRRK